MGAPRPVTPVSILAARLEHLTEELDAARVDPALVAELRRASELAGGLDPYLGRCTSPESPALRALAERTQAEDWEHRPGGGAGVLLEQEMLSGHIEGQLLQFLVRLGGARRVLEIGMFTGYSALAMAEALPDDGTVTACEIDASVAAFAQRCFDESPAGHKIEVRVGPAGRTLDQLAEAGCSYDLVFIDADKAGYLGYLDTLLGTGLLAPGGVVCVDNTLMQGQPWVSGEATANGDAIAAFNQAVADDPRVVQVVLPVRDGITLIRRP